MSSPLPWLACSTKPQGSGCRSTASCGGREFLWTVAALVICGGPASGATFADGLIHDIDGGSCCPFESVMVADGPGPSATTVNILPEGDVGSLVDGSLIASESSIVNMSGGSIAQNLEADDEATIHLSGGTVEGNVITSGASALTSAGGRVEGFVSALGSSSMVLSSIEIFGGINADESGVIKVDGAWISGGAVARGASQIEVASDPVPLIGFLSINAADQSHITVLAGTVALDLSGEASATVSGGSVRRLTASGSGRAEFSGGTVLFGAEITESAVLNAARVLIQGGVVVNGQGEVHLTSFATVEDKIEAEDDALVTISSGGYTAELVIRDRARAHIIRGSVDFLNIRGSFTSTDVPFASLEGAAVVFVSADAVSEFVMSSGIVLFDVSGNTGSSISISGGEIGRNLSVWTSLDFSGGVVRGTLTATRATAAMSGGVIEGDIITRQSAALDISGGEASSNLDVFDDSTVKVRGGSVAGGVELRGNSALHFMGGAIGGSLVALDESAIHVYGTDFNYPYGEIPDPSGTIIGTLADGTPISTAFGHQNTATVTLHEPECGTGAIPGDANRDNEVDGADYTIWADNFGVEPVFFDDGDFNCDGVVDGADYTIWADNFGAGMAAGEPACGLGAELVLLSLLIPLARTRRQRSSRLPLSSAP